jgi:hypothetical protein
VCLQEFTWPPDLSIAKAPSVCSVSVVKHSQYTLRLDILPNYRLLVLVTSCRFPPLANIQPPEYHANVR